MLPFLLLIMWHRKTINRHVHLLSPRCVGNSTWSAFLCTLLLWQHIYDWWSHTLCPKRYAHFFVLTFVLLGTFVDVQYFLAHNFQCCFTGIGAIMQISQCLLKNPDRYTELKFKIIKTTMKYNKKQPMTIAWSFIGSIAFELNLTEW